VSSPSAFISLAHFESAASRRLGSTSEALKVMALSVRRGEHRARERKQRLDVEQRVGGELVEEEHRALALRLLEQLLDVGPMPRPDRHGALELALGQRLDRLALEGLHAELIGHPVVVLVGLDGHAPQRLEQLHGVHAREFVGVLEADLVASQARLVELTRAADAREQVAQRRGGLGGVGQAHERDHELEAIAFDGEVDARGALHERERFLAQVARCDTQQVLERARDRRLVLALLEELDRVFEQLEVRRDALRATADGHVAVERGEPHAREATTPAHRGATRLAGREGRAPRKGSVFELAARRAAVSGDRVAVVAGLARRDVAVAAEQRLLPRREHEGARLADGETTT
jgi:hypothetical protein